MSSNDEKNTPAKNTVGAFVAGLHQEGVSDDIPANVSIPTTFDERLEKISEVSAYEALRKEMTVKEVPILIKDLPKKDPSEEDYAQLKNEEVAKVDDIPLDVAPLAVPKEEPVTQVNEEKHHTISGTQETLKDLEKKTELPVIEKSVYATLGMPVAKKRQPLKDELSLFSLFFIVSILIVGVFLLCSYFYPSILTYLTHNNYIQMVSEGKYVYNQMSVGNLLNFFAQDMSYHLAQMLAAALLALFLALLIDLIVGKSIFLFAKVFIFMVVVIFLGVLVFYLEINGVHILSTVADMIAVFK